MRRFLYILILLQFFWQISFAKETDYIFIQNDGQWPAEVLFRTQIPNGHLWITKSGLIYQITNGKQHEHFRSINTNARISTAPTQSVVKVGFNNSQTDKVLLNQNDFIQNFNFYLGNDPSLWRSNVKSYDNIKLKDVFNGIDFRMYSQGSALKYEFILKPNANANDIQLKYEGAASIKIEQNHLIVETGISQIKEFQPFTFQNNANAKVRINSEFRLENNLLSFKLGNYDKTKELIIDPELVFSTYTGAISDNWSHTATNDAEGNLYAGGTVFGPNFPVTFGTIQGKSANGNNNGGNRTDVVIVKYASDGNKILYSTFLGGNESEVPHSMIVNSKGQLVIYGTTSSINFPTTNSAFDRTYNGGNLIDGPPVTSDIFFLTGTDIFISVIEKNGSKLLGSSFLGGNENDGINDFRALGINNYGDEFRGEVFVDAKDQIYIASTTKSNDFPTKNSIQSKKSIYDAIICKLSSNCESLLFSTFIGGKDYDAAYGIRVDADENIYACGVTVSNDFPTTSGSYTTKLNGDADGFIIKIKNDKLINSTFLGTKQTDIASLLDLDDENNVYVFGLSKGQYPISQGIYNNAKSGQFIHSLNKDLSKSLFSTTFGAGQGIGITDIVPTAFMVNKCGNIYVAGWGGKVNVSNGYNLKSTTKGLAVTDNAFNKNTTGSNYYFAIFEKGFKSLLFGTFFGSASPPNASNERGDHLDGGTCRFDKSGVIYHTACVCKTTGGFVEFPLKNAVSNTHNSNNCNMAAFKFNLDALKTDFNIKEGTILNPVKVCAPADLALDNLTVGGDTYEWFLNNNKISTAKNISYVFADSGLYKVKLIAFDKVSCKASDSTIRFVRVEKFENSVSNDTTICSGGKIKLNASGGISYEWSPITFFKNPNQANQEVELNSTQKFTVKITNSKCTISRDITAKIGNTKPDFEVPKSSTICKGQSLILTAKGNPEKFIWTGTGFKDSTQTSINVKPNTASAYTVQAIYADGCKPTGIVRIALDESVKLDFDVKYEFGCNKKTNIIIENKSSGGIKYNWVFDKIINTEANAPQPFSIDKNIESILNLKTISKNGCPFEIKKEINLEAYDGIIPNVITPNGDLKNETFILGFPKSNLEIYNSLGKLVFKSPEYNNDWGNKAETGTYYYKLTLTNGLSCKGWLEVLK